MDANDDQAAVVGEQATELLDAFQRSVLWHVAHGKRADQIARELSVSEATMRRAIRRARASLGAVSTTHAVYIAAKGGLI